MREDPLDEGNLASPFTFCAAQVRYSVSDVKEPRPSSIYIRDSIPSFSEGTDVKDDDTKKHKKRRDQRKSFTCQTSNEGIIISNRKKYRKKISHHPKLRILPKKNVLKTFLGLRSDKKSLKNLKSNEQKTQSRTEHSNDDAAITSSNQDLDQVSDSMNLAKNEISAPPDSMMAAWELQQSTCSAFIPLETSPEPVQMDNIAPSNSELDRVDCTYAIMFMPWSDCNDDSAEYESVNSDLEVNFQLSALKERSDLSTILRVKEQSTTCSSSFPVSSSSWDSDSTSPSSKSTPVSRRNWPRGSDSSARSLMNWVPDSHSKTCQSCATSFRLTRRRHHCRLCGILVCGSCSQCSAIVVLPQSGLVKTERIRAPWNKYKKLRRNTSISSSFPPDLSARAQVPHRTCRKCANTLHHMAVQGDSRVHKLVSHKKSEKLWLKASSNLRKTSELECLRTPSSISESLSMFDQQYMALSCGSSLTRYVDSLNKRQELDRVKKATSKYLSNSIISNVSFIGERNSVALLEESLSRPPCCSHSSNVYLISSQWLQEWLSYMNLSTDLVQSFSDTLQFDRCEKKRPGPIANYELLDFVDGKLQLRKHIADKMSLISNLETECISTLNDIKFGCSKNFGIISEDLWVALHEMYGGGPSICSSARKGLDESRVYEKVCLAGPAMQNWIILEDESLLFYKAQVDKGSKSWFKHKRSAQKNSRHSVCAPPTSRQQERSTAALSEKLVEGADFPETEQDFPLTNHTELSRKNSLRLLLSYKQNDASANRKSEARSSSSGYTHDRPDENDTIGLESNSPKGATDPVKDTSLKSQVARKTDRLYLAQTGARIGLSTHKFKLDEKHTKGVFSTQGCPQNSRHSSQAIRTRLNQRSRAQSGESDRMLHSHSGEQNLARRMTIGAEEDLEADTVAPVQSEVRGSLAAVTAFATACAEARKKSARSLARYSRSDSLILELMDCADGSACA